MPTITDIDKPGFQAPIPVLEIVAFLDATTAALTGYRVKDIEVDDKLYVLAIGTTVLPKANVPIIVPKITLEVTVSAGLYVLARSEEMITSDTFSNLSRVLADTGISGKRTRRTLSSDEKQFIGDPSREPLRVGDFAIRVSDLGKYIEWRAANKQL